MIQLISYSNTTEKPSNKIHMSTINTPRALDDFKINIIDFSDPNIWKYKGNSKQKVNIDSDLKSLSTMIDESIYSQNVVILPQNITMQYNKQSKGGKIFYNDLKLKDMVSEYKIIIKIAITSFEYDLAFEPTKTKIGKEKIDAAFYFKNNIRNKINKRITTSINSKKTTTVAIAKNIILTTLELDNEKKILNFLNHIGLLKEKSDEPEWFQNVERLDDIEQKKKILKNKEGIIELEQEKNRSEDKLEENNKYKSILYENGDVLEETVIEMLQIMLECDLSNLVDLKKEDFLIKFSDITFIGEIKGVNTNIKSEHLGQLEQHYLGYLDKLQEEDLEENVKQLLIINRQRNIKISERAPIHENQIKLAKRYKSLIIKTDTLLRIFEKYQTDQMSSKEVIELLKDSTGLLSL